MSWQDLGLRIPESAGQTLAWIAALYLTGALMKILVIDPLAKVAGWPPVNLSRFSKLPGNTPYFVSGLVLVWVQAAFAEEMVFRGFLLTRLEPWVGVVGQALVFGVGHRYLGPRGAANATLLGVVLGVAYICDGRNLVPLIVTHGLADSIAAIAIYTRMVRIA